VKRREGLPDFLSAEEVQDLQSRKGYAIHKRETEETQDIISRFLALRFWLLGAGVCVLLAVALKDYLS